MSITCKSPKSLIRDRAIAFISASILTAGLILPSQANNSQSLPPAVESMRTQLLQYYNEQANQLRGPNAGNIWQPVALAPTSFPGPIFSGKETVFISPRMPQGIRGLENVHQMILRTKDNPNLVAAWYESRLVSSGLKMITDGPKVSRPGIYVMRAESNRLTCNVCVTGRNQATPDTTINITVVDKPVL